MTLSPATPKPRKKRDPILGRRVGRLIAIECIEKRNGSYIWRCQCDCGNTALVASGNLSPKRQSSCGCLRREMQSSPNWKPNIKHGLNGSPEHRAWRSIKGHCYDPNNSQFKHYGGRGITVCDEWLNSVEAFYAAVGPRPSPQHSIDRKNVNGNYEPGNVRWATKIEQANNKRCNRIVVYEGREMTFADALREAGGVVAYNTAHMRIQSGWSVERAVTTPAIIPSAGRPEARRG